MFRSLFRIRYLAAVVALLFAIHAVGFLVLGALRSVHAYRLLIEQPALLEEGRPGVPIAESVDALLFALVLIVLSVATASLFLAGPGTRQELPAWMRIRSLTELKLLLWEAILATLVVTAATTVVADTPHLGLKHLVLPAAILVLAISYFLLKRLELTEKEEPPPRTDGGVKNATGTGPE